jgi:hypothetical protein
METQNGADDMAEVTYARAVLDADLEVEKENRIIRLVLKIDTEISDLLDYFSIFQPRMEMYHRATERFGFKFRLRINDTDL